MDIIIKTIGQFGYTNPDEMGQVALHLMHDEDGNVLIFQNYGSTEQTVVAINRDDLFQLFAANEIEPSDEYTDVLDRLNG